MTCQFCPPTCSDCKGERKCDCHELVDGHGGVPLEVATAGRKMTDAEAAALLTLVQGGWLKLELAL